MHIIDSAARIPCENGVWQADGLLAEMDRWSVARAVVAPDDEFVAVYNEEGNRLIAEAVRSHPDRFSGLAAANPWYGAKALEALRSAFDDGLVGLYVHPPRQGFRLTEKILHPLIEVCESYGRPVYSHTGTPVCAMPFQLAEVARTYPRTTFVLGHCAWSDFAGYDVIPAAQQAANIVVETSCATGELVRLLLAELGPERVVFGSGYPRSPYRHEVNKVTRLELPSDVADRFLRANALSLWKLPE